MKTTEIKTLSLEEIKINAPQAFATTPGPGVSDKYTFLPTSRVMEDMAKLGWEVCEAKTSRYRNDTNRSFGKHIIKFYNKDIFISDGEGGVEAYPNIVVMNSHTGRGSFRFEMGIFRLVCSNGLVIKDQDMGSFELRHKGYSFEELQLTIEKAVDNLPSIVSRINSLSSRIMTKQEQHKFAQEAFKLRAGEDRVLTAQELEAMLAPKRPADAGDNLWKVLNRVQESVIKGGFSAVNASGKLRRIKGIKNIEKDLNINQSIWELSTQYA
jgi:hypothetical protein